jgi:hypothetical protein
MHRDAKVVPVQVRDQLSEDVLSLANLDPQRVGLEYIDSRLFRGVQKD